MRLKTLADVFAYAASQGMKLRVDGTEVRVRRPTANRPGRRAFVSGKKKQNTIKSTAVSDADGRLLWLGAFRPGRMHDVTALRTEGIEDLLRASSAVLSADLCRTAIAEPKQWRPLRRYLGRRAYFQETALAIAGLVSDRAATR